MSLPPLDFDRAARTRMEMLNDLAGRVPDDVLSALSMPGVPDALLSEPFCVVDRWEDLAGPRSGVVDVPEDWRSGLPDRIAVNDADSENERCILYQRILLQGTHSDLERHLHPEVLRGLWARLVEELPRAVTSVWEQRFPQLVEANLE